MTVGRAGRYVQAGLVILPKIQAYDFLVFCQRNSKSCPLLEVTDPGDPVPQQLAPSADLRTDIGLYSIIRDGSVVDEVPDIRSLWQEDFVAFLLGSSLTFSQALVDAGCTSSVGIGMYKTNVDCRPAGRFAGKMVVTMQALPAEKVSRAVQVTSRFERTHGTPVHIGNPETIGICNLSDYMYRPELPIPDGHIPMFWACSVTPQVVAQESGIEFMITHSSGHGFVTDYLDYDIANP